MLEGTPNEQMHSSFYNKVENIPLQWKNAFSQVESMMCSSKLIPVFDILSSLWMNECLPSREENHGKQHSQWSETEIVAAFNISLISVNVWNYFKGRSDFQQGLVTPVTIRSWTEPWELSGFSAHGRVGLSPLRLQVPFKKPSGGHPLSTALLLTQDLVAAWNRQLSLVLFLYAVFFRFHLTWLFVFGSNCVTENLEV